MQLSKGAPVQLEAHGDGTSGRLPPGELADVMRKSTPHEQVCTAAADRIGVYYYRTNLEFFLINYILNA